MQNLFAIYLQTILQELLQKSIQSSQVLGKKKPGKGTKLYVLAREMGSTEKKTVGYVGRDLLNTVGNQP